MVRRLGLCAFIVVARGRSLIEELRFCKLSSKNHPLPSTPSSKKKKKTHAGVIFVSQTLIWGNPRFVKLFLCSYSRNCSSVEQVLSGLPLSLCRGLCQPVLFEDKVFPSCLVQFWNVVASLTF